MKKISCLLLSAVMLFALLTGCGGSPEEVSEEEEKKTEEKVDFNGYNFVFRTWTGYIDKFLITDSGKSTTISDYKLQQFKNAEKKFNCTIETALQPTWSSLGEFIEKKAAAGADYETEFEYDIRMKVMYDLGAVVDLLNYDDILDFSDTDKWGTVEDRLDCMAPDGALYAMNGAYWPSNYSCEGVLYVNDELIEYLGAVAPQEYLEKGQWTFGNFAQILSTYCLKENGDEENYIRGMMLYHCNSPMLAYSALISNGVHFIVEADGRSTFNLGSSDAITALQWAQDILSLEDCVEEAPYHTNPIFSSGLSTLYLADGIRGLNVGSDYEMQTNLNDFSWMCFPYGPAVEYGKSLNGYRCIGKGDCDINGSGIGIMNGEMATETAYVLGEIFEPIEALGEDGYWGYLHEYFFHDEESYERYYNMYMNKVVEDIRPISGSECETLLEDTISSIIRGEMSPTQGISSINEAMQTYIEASPYSKK